MMSDRLNIINTIEKDGKFSTFARLLKSSKAADLITGDGPFTVFAPTNDAFGKVPDAQMNSLQNQTDQTDLAKLLSYHIVPSKLFSSKLGTRGLAATLSGAEVTFSETDGLKVNESGVQARNIEATNGIIHALDTVLTPPTEAIAASAAATASAAAPMATAPAPAPSPTPVAATVTQPTAQADGHSDVAAVKTDVAANGVAAMPATAAPSRPTNPSSNLP